MMLHRVVGLSCLVAAVACRGGGARGDDGGPARDGRPTSRSVAVTILHTNDIHGTLEPFVVDTGDATAQTGDPGRAYQQYSRAGVVGGAARLASAVERVRARRGRDRVLLVDAGDTFGDGLLANLTRGEATIRVMNALGYQFMALGNHDFEYGAARTRELQTVADFPMRAANVRDDVSGMPFLGDPTRVVESGGVRVGLLALGYHNTPETGNRRNTEGLTFTSGIDAARRLVPALRERADVVVVVSHQGTVIDSVLAEGVPGIDVIVGGHSHDRITPPRRVGGSWMVQALSDASALGELTLTVEGGRVTRLDGTVHELFADRFATAASVEAFVDSLRRPHRDTLEAVLARASSPIGRQYKSESPVDRLAGDILRRHASAEVAFLPGLGFGVTLRPGLVTREALAGLFPHPTPVVRVTLTGAQVLEVLEQSATNLRPVDPMDRVGGLVQTSGVRWTADLTRPVGRRVRDVQIASAPLDVARRYLVVTTGGMLQGTHRYTTFAAGEAIVREPAQMLEVLEAGFRQLRDVTAPPMGDVRLIR
jgi:2',3'-cyclic-nucleotide 2'-phosphodiesterase (5'-nucleotidase family)